MSDKIVQLTDANFEQDVLTASLPILVDFWADWCGPCKIIAPTLDELAIEYAGKLIIGKLNIDQHPQSAPKYGVRGIPALLLFKDAQVVATQVGAVSKQQLKAFIDPHL